METITILIIFVVVLVSLTTHAIFMGKKGVASGEYVGAYNSLRHMPLTPHKFTALWFGSKYSAELTTQLYNEVFYVMYPSVEIMKESLSSVYNINEKHHFNVLMNLSDFIASGYNISNVSGKDSKAFIRANKEIISQLVNDYQAACQTISE